VKPPPGGSARGAQKRGASRAAAQKAAIYQAVLHAQPVDGSVDCGGKPALPHRNGAGCLRWSADNDETNLGNLVNRARCAKPGRSSGSGRNDFPGISRKMTR